MSFSSIKPNVLIIIATGITGGPGKGLFQLLGRSTSLGFDYTLCNFERTYVNSESDQFRKTATSLGIGIFFIKQTLQIDPFLILRAIKIKKSQKTNIVQTHGYKPNVIGLFLKYLMRTPWIAFAHGYTNDNFKMKIYNRLDLLILRHADIIVAVSSSMKLFLTMNGINCSRISIIPNAVDKNQLVPSINCNDLRISLGIKETESIISVVGRLGPEKGHAVFLKAFREVLRQFPQTKALIIGDGQERQKLVDFSEQTNITQHVIFTGHVNNPADYYQIIDLLVIPSLSEGLPNVLLEAMVLGIPVIATSVGGIPEIIDNRRNGILVPPDDQQRMAHEIISLLSNWDQAPELADNARATVLSYADPSTRAEKIASLYRTILAH